jgi:hypothetical protein
MFAKNWQGAVSVIHFSQGDTEYLSNLYSLSSQAVIHLAIILGNLTQIQYLTSVHYICCIAMQDIRDLINWCLAVHFSVKRYLTDLGQFYS